MNTSTLRTGLVFALLQLFFTLTWTVYVIYLPRVAAPNGNPLLFPAITFACGGYFKRICARINYTFKELSSVVNRSTSTSLKIWSNKVYEVINYFRYYRYA